jgi:hypothetical protein
VPLFSKEAMVLWALGIGLMASLIPEGGAYEWSGILLQDHMGIGKGLNAAAATSFSLAMIVSRLLGDKSFERWGYVNTVKYGGYFGGGIWGLSLLIGIPLSDTNQMLSLIIVCIGFAAAGLGMGPFCWLSAYRNHRYRRLLRRSYLDGWNRRVNILTHSFWSTSLSLLSRWIPIKTY